MLHAVQNLDKLAAKRDQLIETLSPLQDILRGSLVRYVHEDCRCHPNGRYGPYWYLSVKTCNKTHMRKLPDSKVPLVRKAVQNYNSWWKTCLEIFELNTQILHAQGKDS